MTRNRRHGCPGDEKGAARQGRKHGLTGLLVFLFLLLLLAGVLLLRYRAPDPVAVQQTSSELPSAGTEAAEARPSDEAGRGQNMPAATTPTVPAAMPAAGAALPADAARDFDGAGQTDPQPDLSPRPDPGPSPSASVAAQPAGEPTQDRPDKAYDEHTYQLVTDIIYTMRNRGEEEEPSIRALLAELKEADPDLGAMWEGIADYWFDVCRDFTVNAGQLPDGLPQDDSLGIVVLGFQLLSDGQMAPELIGRLETALACAAQYPNARLIVTGGGTASGNRSATEADVMASWLEEHGIEKTRIIVENRSLTTDQNASNTCAILAGQYPQIRQLAIVSSDYHVALGSMLFAEAALLYAYEHDCAVPYEVVSNAGFATSGNPVYSNPRMFPSDMWILADPHY